MTCDYENPHVQVAYIGSQANILAADDLAAGDAALFDTLEIVPTFNRRNQAQAYGGRGVSLDVEVGDGPHDWTFMSEMIPTGTAGTAWDTGPLYECFWSKSDRAAVDINGTPSTTGCEVPEGSFVVGDLVAIPVSGIYHVRKITTVTNDPGVKDTLVWAPALSTAPSASDQIAACDKFTLRACLDADKFVTIARTGNKKQEQVSGACPTEFTLSLAKEQVDITFKGLAAHYQMAGPTTLSSGIDDSVTAMTVVDKGLFTGMDTNAPLYLSIAAEGSNTLEVVKVTGYVESTGVCTIARAQKSTSASAHAQGAVITPYLYTLTPTRATQAVSGVSGIAVIDGIAVEMRAMTLTDNEGFLPRLPAGSRELSGYVSEGRREIKISMELFSGIDEYNAIGNAVSGTKSDVWFAIGEDDGYMIFGRLPRVQFAPPTQTTKPGDVAVFTMEGTAFDSTTTANDAMVLYQG